MEILITGATGFLGTGLSAHLESLGHRVVRLGSRNCDLTQADSLDRFDDRRYDQIYHLAAWTQAGDFCLRHPGEQWLINQQINTNVLSWWQRRQPQAKLIAMGTSCAYAPDRELIEENYLEGQPIDSLFTYAMTKRMLYVGLHGPRAAVRNALSLPGSVDALRAGLSYRRPADALHLRPDPQDPPGAGHG